MSSRKRSRSPPGSSGPNKRRPNHVVRRGSGGPPHRGRGRGNSDFRSPKDRNHQRPQQSPQQQPPPQQEDWNGEKSKSFEDILSAHREKRKWWLRQNNPHCQQADLSDIKADHECYRILPRDAPRRTYQPRNGGWRSIQHWGQRKLLLSEIEMLTAYSSPHHKVLYAGAAPGTHIAALSEMFPEQHFVLVDPNDFTVRETDKIEIHQEFFTDEFCERFKDQSVLFISDIRTANPEKMSKQEVEQRVKVDMDAQQKWHQILQPYRSMLKFRLPYFPGVTEYLDGFLWLPVWGRVQTTEARLVAAAHTPLRNWDNSQHEEQFYHFNTVTRVKAFPHNVKNCEGLDHCYDCAAEVEILKEYLCKFIHKWLPDRPASVQKELEGVAASVKALLTEFAELEAEEEKQMAQQPGPCPPPRCVVPQLNLSPRQDALIAAEIKLLSERLSRECSNTRTLKDAYAPTQERGYNFKSKMEKQLKPVPAEHKDFGSGYLSPTESKDSTQGTD